MIKDVIFENDSIVYEFDNETMQCHIPFIVDPPDNLYILIKNVTDGFSWHFTTYIFDIPCEASFSDKHLKLQRDYCNGSLERYVFDVTTYKHDDYYRYE